MVELQAYFDKDRFMDAYESHAKNMPQVELEIDQTLYGGILTRRAVIPKGCLFTGASHKKESIVIQIYGDASILNDDGSESRITGYTTMLSKAGTRRMVLTHAESMWIGFYATNALNVDDALIEQIDEEKTDISRLTGIKNIKSKELSCYSLQLQ